LAEMFINSSLWTTSIKWCLANDSEDDAKSVQLCRSAKALIPAQSQQLIIINYWMRSGKIVWFVSGEQIRYQSWRLWKTIDLWETLRQLKKQKSTVFQVREVICHFSPNIVTIIMHNENIICSYRKCREFWTFTFPFGTKTCSCILASFRTYRHRELISLLLLLKLLNVQM